MIKQQNGKGMQNLVKLSVIIPVYNVAEYLEQCINSVLKQEYDKYELILVDDGSTDESGHICDKYAQQHTGIKVVHQKNQGHTAARQKGFEIAEGDYIFFMDSDDWIDPRMFSVMMKKADNTNADIIQCDYCSETKKSKVVAISPFESGFYDRQRMEREIYPRMIYDRGFYHFGIAPNLWNKFFKRYLVEKFLPVIDRNIKSGEDGIFTYSCLLQADSIFLVSGCCFYHYRSRENSMCRITDDQRLNENHILFCYYEEWLYGMEILKNQIEHYVVYQTLQAINSLIQKQKIWNIKRKYRFLQRDSLEAVSIRNVKLRDVEGKRNRLILAWLKIGWKK